MTRHMFYDIIHFPFLSQLYFHTTTFDVEPLKFGSPLTNSEYKKKATTNRSFHRELLKLNYIIALSNEKKNLATRFSQGSFFYNYIVRKKNDKC